MSRLSILSIVLFSVQFLEKEYFWIEIIFDTAFNDFRPVTVYKLDLAIVVLDPFSLRRDHFLHLLILFSQVLCLNAH